MKSGTMRRVKVFEVHLKRAATVWVVYPDNEPPELPKTNLRESEYFDLLAVGAVPNDAVILKVVYD